MVPSELGRECPRASRPQEQVKLKTGVDLRDTHSSDRIMGTLDKGLQGLQVEGSTLPFYQHETEQRVLGSILLGSKFGSRDNRDPSDPSTF